MTLLAAWCVMIAGAAVWIGSRALDWCTAFSLDDPAPSPRDWATIDRPTDAEILAAIAADPDAAPLLDEAWSHYARTVAPRHNDGRDPAG